MLESSVWQNATCNSEMVALMPEFVTSKRWPFWNDLPHTFASRSKSAPMHTIQNARCGSIVWSKPRYFSKRFSLNPTVPGDLQKESRYILAANDAQVPSHAQWWACFLIQSFGTADRNEFMQQISAAGFERPELVHKIHDDFHGRICICNPIQLGDVKNIHQLFKVSVMWFVRRTRLT